MLRKRRHKKLLTQKFLVMLLSASMTTFLLGGLTSYWAINKFQTSVNEAADAPGGPGAKGKPGRPQAQLVRVGTIERQKIVPVKTLVGDLIAVRSATIATEVAGKMVELAQ